MSSYFNLQSLHTFTNDLYNSHLVRDIIIGMSDGLTVPFALTAGLSGVLNTTHLTGESEVEHYDTELKREFSEIDTVPKTELEEWKIF
jgi:vacuolar iron transporter family protein